MTEDIVERLRNWDDQQPPFAIMEKAADEIEKLRDLKEYWKNTAKTLFAFNKSIMDALENSVNDD